MTQQELLTEVLHAQKTLIAGQTQTNQLLGQIVETGAVDRARSEASRVVNKAKQNPSSRGAEARSTVSSATRGIKRGGR